MSGRFAAVICVAALVASDAAAAPKPKPTAKPRAAKVMNSIRGATQMFAAPWGLVAQGSGQLRILPSGAAKWQVVRKVAHGSLYRVAFDDGGRVLAWWEKEASLHLFTPGAKPNTTTDQTFELPPPPDPDLKYGYFVENMYFESGGDSAIVFMSGFTGGRTWETVGYRFDLKGGGAPALLFQQKGYTLAYSARMLVVATPKNPDDMCEHTACQPLGAVIAWQIDGAKATKKVLLDGAAHKEDFSRVDVVWGGDADHVAVVVTEHPRGRHLLRWQWGDAKATLTEIPEGPWLDPANVWLAASGDVTEFWVPEDRSLEIRRYPAKGKATTTTLAPLPKRTPHDHPLFDVPRVMERQNGDLLIQWGEYLLLAPPGGAIRRLDLRSVFLRKTEFSGRLIYVPSPEGVWIAIESGKNEDFTFLSQAELESRMTAAPTQ